MTSQIDRLWPSPASALDDDALLDAYAFGADGGLRMNFVTSLDGAATRDGVSGALGGDADGRVFELIRRLADVVLVGAGTVRAEGYDAMRLDDDAVAWRTAHGFAPQPTFAIVSRSLNLDPESAVFADATVRPIVYGSREADSARAAALGEVADVVLDDDPVAVRSDLRARGLTRIHSEGGPSLFGSFVADGVVDELCLTAAPTLEAGGARRISTSPEASPTGMRLVTVLRSGDELLLRYAAA